MRACLKRTPCHDVIWIKLAFIVQGIRILKGSWRNCRSVVGYNCLVTEVEIFLMIIFGSVSFVVRYLCITALNVMSLNRVILDWKKKGKYVWQQREDVCNWPVDGYFLLPDSGLSLPNVNFSTPHTLICIIYKTRKIHQTHDE